MFFQEVDLWPVEKTHLLAALAKAEQYNFMGYLLVCKYMNLTLE